MEHDFIPSNMPNVDAPLSPRERWIARIQATLLWLLGATPLLLLGTLILSIGKVFDGPAHPDHTLTAQALQMIFILVLLTSPMYVAANWWFRKKQRALRATLTAWDKTPGQLKRTLHKSFSKLLTYVGFPTVVVVSCELFLWIMYQTSGSKTLAGIMGLALALGVLVILASLGLYLTLASGEVMAAAAHDRDVLIERRAMDAEELIGGLALAQPSTSGDLSAVAEHGALEIHQEVTLDLDEREEASQASSHPKAVEVRAPESNA